tara:strand:- start:473 stop:1264 length:792 start_codon:yes stop_codon:yes gene_type:complete
MKKLVTFGCSWTFGTGSAFENGMTKMEYRNISADKELCRQNAFRTILAEHYQYKNVNYSVQGSSNQRQFRHARKYFATNELAEDKVIVLWFITSTARHEVYCTNRWGKEGNAGYSNVLYGNGGTAHEHMMRKCNFDSKQYVKDHYNHEEQVRRLRFEMLHWNRYFEGRGIENYWIDTFNHHDYGAEIPRLLFDKEPRRDVLYQMLNARGISIQNDSYHISQYTRDSKRIDTAVRLGLVNPYSYHPTKAGHYLIAELINRQIAL